MSESDWTPGLLKEHFDALRHADQDALRAALVATTKAVEVLATNQNDYRAQQNEWRGTISDIMSKQQGSHTGMKELWSGILAVLAMVVSVGALILSYGRK